MLRVLLRRGALAPLIMAVFLGVAWTIHLHATGLRMSGDSALFAHTALILEATGEWTAPATRPPLYPMMLAGFMTIEPFAANAAAWLSGLSLTALLMVLGSSLYTRTRSGWVSAAVVLCAAMWSPMVGVFEVMWTEGPCALLLLLHVVLVRSEEDNKDGLRLPLAGAAVGLAATTRFLAVAAVLAFVVWLFRRRPSPRDLLSGAIALGLPAGWMLRSHLVHGSATGERRPSATGWEDNIMLLAESLRDALTAAPVLGAVLAASIAALTIGRRLPRYLSLQLVAQLSAIIVATSMVAVDPIGPRYVAPVLPLVLLYVGDAWHWLDARPTPHRRTIGSIAAAAVTLAAVSAAVPQLQQQRLIDTLEPRSSHGRGFVTSTTRADLSAALQQAVAGQEEVHIVVTDGRNSMWQWGSISRHRSVWQEAGIEVVSLRPDGDHTVHFSAVTSTGAPLELHIHRGAPFRNAAKLQQLVRRIEHDGAPLFAIAHSGDLRRGLGASSLQEVLGSDVMVSLLASPAPYQLARVHEPPPAEPGAAPPTAEASPTKPSPHLQPAKDHGLPTVFHPQPPPSSLTCTRAIPVNGSVRLSGRWRGSGLPEDSVARIMVGFKDATGTTIPANHKSVFHRAGTLQGNAPWRDLDTLLEVPGARSAKACVKVVGGSTQGTVKLDAFEMSAASPKEIHAIN